MEDASMSEEHDTIPGPGCTLNHLLMLLSSASLRESALKNDRSTTDATGHTQHSSVNRRFDECYIRQERLRSGSFGTVYTCRHKLKPDVTFAVKIMDRKRLKEKDVSAVFREVKILCELAKDTEDEATPRYIVELIDFFVEPDYFYMVQVYAAGGDVFDRLTSRKTYTEKDARDLSKKLLETIHFLHTHKPYPIVHRDLKPENLLLCDSVDDTHILVADFGFARQIRDNERCETRCGTPAFVSPEILLGLSYTTTVDLWSTGCLLYMLIGGYPPFQAPNHRALFRKIRAGDFIFHEQTWKNVSVGAKRLITHLLTVNESTRSTAEEALRSDWFDLKPSQLAKVDLSASLMEMQDFKPKNTWKKALRALGFCATAPFWKPDAVSFSMQMAAWDNEELSAATKTSGSAASHDAALMYRLPHLKFGDRYELKRQLRKGSYARVWECVHKQSQTVYAVKVITREGLQAKDDEAVLNEVAIMQSLSGNKYTVQLMDFYEEDDHFFLVMEYCAGGDVFDRIVQYVQYTENDARALAITLLKAVESLHKVGIAHRDIKPQNLFLLSPTDNSTIRVGDFGFARRVHTPESLTSRVGTPTYVAPEILKNLPHDERVDLWSVGVVIFVLLVGYSPFLDENQSNLFRKIRTGEWVFFEKDWKNISEEAKELVRGLLKVDPKDRWTVERCLRCSWIRQDSKRLSSNDLSVAVRQLQQIKARLRMPAGLFMGIDEKCQSVDATTQAQTTASGAAMFHK